MLVKTTCHIPHFECIQSSRAGRIQDRRNQTLSSEYAKPGFALKEFTRLHHTHLTRQFFFLTIHKFRRVNRYSLLCTLDISECYVFLSMASKTCSIRVAHPLSFFPFIALTFGIQALRPIVSFFAVLI